MDPRTFNPEELQKLISRARIEAELERTGSLLPEKKQRKSKAANRQAQVLTQAYERKAQTAAEALQADAQDEDSRYFREYLNSLIQASDSGIPTNPEQEREIRNLRNRLDKAQRALKAARIHDFISPYREVFNRLVASGLPENHAAVLVRKAEKILVDQEPVGEQRVFHLIRTQISGLFKDYNPVAKMADGQQRIILLAGATGVGKTSTLMKIARRPDILSRGSLAIISTDSYRLAATKELELFSEITGLPFFKVSNLEELRELKPRLKGFATLLIDTAGRSPSFPGYIREMQELVDLTQPTDVLLTLSMANDLDDLFMSSGIYSALAPTALVFTKLDETCKVGKMITLAAELSLPIAYISDGQKIPDDLHEPSGIHIWDKMIQTLEG